MQVELNKRYPLAVSMAQAWAVLADVRAVAACMPGAQITEQLDATHYKGTVKSKVGPAVMMFNGDIEVLGVDAAAHRMEMLAKGADKGGSTASMNLAATIEAGDTSGASTLVGVATVTISGKLAQFGSRLLVPISDAMLAQFADHFRAAAAQVAPPVIDAAPMPSANVDGPPAGTQAAATVSAAQPSAATRPSLIPAATPPAMRAPAMAPTELNAMGLMWTVFKGWFAGLFGKKTA